MPSLHTLETLEQWLVIAYGGNKLPEDVQSIPQLRWYLFSKYQYEAEKLPPTPAAFKYKVFRSHFFTLVLRRSLVALQNLPNPLNYGWEMINNTISPIMTDELPAPLALIELSVCGCKTTCNSNRCKCFKNKLNCTDMCKCTNCENDGVDNEDEDEQEDPEYSDDEI